MAPDQPDPMDQQKNTSKENAAWSRWFLPALGLLVLLVVVGVDSRPAEKPLATAILDRPNPQIGPKDAPVTVVEFGDYGCSSCLIWAGPGCASNCLINMGTKCALSGRISP